VEFGYLTLTVDGNDPSAPTLTIDFTCPAHPSAADQLKVTLT
jgi:hypothetical protein